MTKLFIQMKDGQPVGHAVHEDNLRMLGIDPNDPTDDFEPYEFSPAPAIHPLEDEYYEQPVRAENGKWTRPRRAEPKPQAERERITARYVAFYQRAKAELLQRHADKRGKSAKWDSHIAALEAFDVTANPFNPQWPVAPDQLPTMKVHRG